MILFVSLLRHYQLQYDVSVYFIFSERDVIADANILQGAIFHEDAVEEPQGHRATESNQNGNQNGKVENMWPVESRSKQLKSKSQPAAHRVNKVVFHCERLQSVSYFLH